MLKRKRTSKLAWSVLVFAAVIPAAVSQPAVARISSQAQRVVDALRLAGVVVAPDQIELLSGVRSAEEGASLRVVSTTDTSPGTAKVKLRCQDNHECLPFYVLVHNLDKADVGSVRMQAVPVVVPATQASVPQNVIRGGDHATLILESADARMNLPVICLQSGVRGQTIRVASPDHRQFFDGVIVAPGILKGSL